MGFNVRREARSIVMLSPGEKAFWQGFAELTVDSK